MSFPGDNGGDVSRHIADSDEQEASRTPGESSRELVIETRYQGAAGLMSLDAQQMRASIGARLFGTSADPVRVGRYTILRRLGAGGMGVVYAAFDEELDRKVAVKLLLQQHEDSSEQLIQEAQALARLSHPNVVQIFEVGRHNGRVFLAMEFVEGQTLRSWRPQASVDEVLEVFIGAAQGLAAAHAKGLVHRDFKPENVLVDREGRARVLDFGLARGMKPVVDREGGSPAHEDASNIDPVETVDMRASMSGTGSAVMTGRAAGTPAYMAPEQFELRGLTAATDQFAFCVTPWERMTGSRPFEGESISQLCEHVCSGALSERNKERIPVALRRVLTRGLEVAAESRWPSMEALVAALRRYQQRPQRIRRGLVGLAGLVIAVGLGARAMMVASEDPCADIDGMRDRIWNPELDARLAAQFVRSGLPYAADASTTVRNELSAYADRWHVARKDACMQSISAVPETREIGMRRSLCLTQRRRAFEGVTAILGAADSVLIERATDSIAQLPDVEACAELGGLGAWSSPSSEAERADLEALNTELARAESALSVYRIEEASDLVRGAVETAEALGHVPTLARAYLLSGRIARRRRDSERAAKELAQARRLSDRLGDDLIRAQALTELVRVVGSDLARYEEGLELADDARAALERLGGNPLQAAALENHLGSLYRRMGDLKAAANHHQRAKEIYRSRLGDAHPDTATADGNLGIVAAMRGDFSAAAEAFERVLNVVKRRVGARHPAMARQLMMQANVMLLRAKTVTGAERIDLARRCVSILERVLIIQEAVYGPEDLRLDDALHNLGLAQMLAGEYTAARKSLMGALDKTQARLREDHPDVLETKVELGQALCQLGERDTATTMLTDVLAALERQEATAAKLGAAQLALAECVAARAPGRAKQLVEEAGANLGGREAWTLLDQERIATLRAAD